jgi:hypothetical protein
MKKYSVKYVQKQTMIWIWLGDHLMTSIIYECCYMSEGF